MSPAWQRNSLSAVCSKVTDGSHNPPKGIEHSEFMMLSSKNICDDDLHFEAPRYLSAEHFQEENKRTQVVTGDVLLTIVGTIGRCAVVPPSSPKITLQRSVAVLRPRDTEIDSRFLMYSFLERTSELHALARGVAQKGIYLETLRALAVTYPPLAEQQRIVGVLDEAFDGIATAKANAEKNLQNARALFESHLQSVFKQGGSGWTEAPLGELATFRNGINFTKSSKGDSIKILGVKDFQNSFWAPLDDLESVIPDGTLPDSDTLRKGDLVFVRSNGNPELIGRCLLVGDVSERTTHSGFTIRARLNDGAVLPSYLCHFLKSSVVRREMVDGGNGANIKSLNQGTLSRLVIPLPPSSQQAQIVRQIEAMSEETQHLESLYQRKLTALDELKKSLLHQAFSGAL